MLLLVTGLPSPGKTQLVDALSDRLGSALVVAGTRATQPAPAPTLHVHAETDFEAWVEGDWPSRDAARHAELVVKVDWESVERSVDRVMKALGAKAACVAGS
jgi:hypothetical protein